MAYDAPDEIKPSDTPDTDQVGALDRMRVDSSGTNGRIDTDLINTGDEILGRFQLVAFQTPSNQVRPPGASSDAPEPPPVNEAPQAPGSLDDRAVITRENGQIKTIEQTKHKFKLTFDNDDQGRPRITTSFTPRPDGNNKPDQVYIKDNQGWYFKGPDGQQIRMQGDLQVDQESGKFTQVLRKDMDGQGDAKVTTRTMDADGTVTINRMDGTQSIFKYDENGKKIAWSEKDCNGSESKFLKDTDSQGHECWRKAEPLSVNNPAIIRYEPKIEDNGNLTYKTQEDLDKPTTQVVTTSGERLINGENGVKYDFNYRGDVSSIQFPKPRLFEGHIVSRIDIAYRDPFNNQGQIIDSLKLYGADGKPSDLFERVPSASEKQDEAYDQWNLYSADLARNQYLFKGQSVGDFAIKNGLISTTESLSGDDKQLAELIANNPNYGPPIEAYKNAHQGKLPPAVLLTYTNEVTAAPDSSGKISKPSDAEYRVEVFERVPGIGPEFMFDYFVPGEKQWKLSDSSSAVIAPPPVIIPTPPPTIQNPPTSRPAVRSRNARIGNSTRVV